MKITSELIQRLASNADTLACAIGESSGTLTIYDFYLGRRAPDVR